MRLLQFGPNWTGSTSTQRLSGFQSCLGANAIGVDSGYRLGRGSIVARIFNRAGFTLDRFDENKKLLSVTGRERPDVVFVDASRVIRRTTLVELKAKGVAVLCYYTPDNILKRHNSSLWLRSTLSDWDILFTTKAPTVPDLRAAGVRRPILVGKAYDPDLHFPERNDDPDFEKFDLVFIGTWEQERQTSIETLANAGFSIVIYGDIAWLGKQLPPSVTIRPPALGDAFRHAMHHGKLALNFLRKINDDEITQRSVEIPAMARPMLAERTREHDAHFVDGVEYAGFSDDRELVAVARALLSSDERRLAIAQAGLARCIHSRYAIADRAREMIDHIERVRLEMEGHEAKAVA